MAVYISATIMSVAISILSVYAKKKGNKLFFYILAVLAILPLFCVSAFRYNVGTDYPYTYTKRFLWRANGADLSAIFEFGFIWLIDIILFFTKNPYWLFIVCSAIFICFVFKAIYQQSNWVPYSILVLVIGRTLFWKLKLNEKFYGISYFSICI